MLRPASSLCASDDTARAIEAVCPAEARPLRTRRYRKQAQALPAQGGGPGGRKDVYKVTRRSRASPFCCPGRCRCGRQQSAGKGAPPAHVPDAHTELPGTIFLRQEEEDWDAHSTHASCREGKVRKGRST